MRKTIFNDNWTVFKEGDVSTKKAVTLPHDAMMDEERKEENPGGVHTAWFAGGDYIYEKAFTVPLSDSNKKIVFEFEGAYRNAEVSINGQKAGQRPYGYTNFYVDASAFLEYGKENKIEVVCRNSEQPNSRWYSGSGLYRPVNMYALPEKHILINGIKIKCLEVSIPKLEVTVNRSAPGGAEIAILDGNKVIKTVTLSEGQDSAVIELPGAMLWSPEQPKLYTCRVTFGGDTAEERFGIRKVDCDAKQGLRINNKRVILRGACVHHDNGLLGAAGHPFAERRKIKLLQAAGYNAIRSAHNPCSKAMLDVCDELGMLVLDEYVDMWYIHKTPFDYAGYFDKWWRQDMSDMVDKDYNHPSVIMYSIGNEVSETGQARGIGLTGEMTEYLHKIDNSRPVTCGVNIFFNYLSSLGFGVYSDKKAKKEAAKDHTKKKKAVGSEFFNNLAGIFGDKVMKIGATLGGSDRRTRDAFAKLDVAGYNYGIMRNKKDVKKYPDRVILGSETFCTDAYKFYEFAKKHPALIGDFVWAGMDYLGEAGIGAWEYRNYAKDFTRSFGWLTAGSGKLDITGKGGGESAYTRVAFELDKIRMAVVPVDHAFQKHSPSAWRASNAIESWAWNGREGRETIVEVYAKAHKAALFLNGNKLAEKKIKKKDCFADFKVVFQPGELTAVSYDEAGKEIARCSLKSAEKATKLSLVPEDKIVSAEDGLCYVRLRYTDENGLVRPRTHGKIEVKVENGTLLGLGHACPYNTDGYKNAWTEAYYGEALAIIRPDGKGKVTVAASSPYGNAVAEIAAE